MQESDTNIWRKLKQGNHQVFTSLFNTYYKGLVLFGGNFIRNQAVCEDIVQSVFMKLWRERESLHIETSLKSYLVKSVQNACLDEIRHLSSVEEHQQYSINTYLIDLYDTEHYMLYSDLQEHLEKALAKLPPGYREVIEMSRLEKRKYKEIAQKLQISERTVEARMYKALNLLRIYLKDFLSLFVLLFLQ